MPLTGSARNAIKKIVPTASRQPAITIWGSHGKSPQSPDIMLGGVAATSAALAFSAVVPARWNVSGASSWPGIADAWWSENTDVWCAGKDERGEE